MANHQHIEGRESCPFLPPSPQVIRPAETRPIRESGNQGTYYIAALTCAQSLWLEGLPAQSILQLNHALSVDLDADDPAVIQWPLPYQAKVWIFTRRHEEGFLGNPTRHYQHLASRMSGPNSELRTWRGWACFHLSERVLPADEFPRDEPQIEKEQLVIPTWEQTLTEIRKLGLTGEAETLSQLLLG
ncbi:MAG: hypothetical protein QNL39_06050 [Akkermansiaceae bacterium]|jgi:hypothetical protein|tara:strand:+ start:1597 stop:2157 length:561 start_codon:yes stop_codon:yes gene_type:complete